MTATSEDSAMFFPLEYLTFCSDLGPKERLVPHEFELRIYAQLHALKIPSFVRALSRRADKRWISQHLYGALIQSKSA